MSARRSTKPPFVGAKVQRVASVRWVPLARIRVNPVAQREFKMSWAAQLAAEFDLEQLGTPTVNLREGWYYVIDGQHRIGALKLWLGEGKWEDQHVECSAYEGMSEEEEADAFLKLNNKLGVSTFTKFRVGVKAGRPEETHIVRIVESNGLKISDTPRSGAISAVGTLQKVYRTGGAETLERTLRVVRDAYGPAGFTGPVLDGIGLLCNRFNGRLDDGHLIKRLSVAHGGVSGLLNKAEQARQRYGGSRANSVAAAAVEIYNTGRQGKKLPNWWKSDPE